MESKVDNTVPPRVDVGGPDAERLMTNRELIEAHGADTLIECQSCYRTFHTQAQFGQHSRICRGGSGTSRRFIDCKSQPFKYCYLERQSKDKLEIKSRFTVHLQSPAVVWKDVVKMNGLHDSGIAEDLKRKQLERVHVAIRHSQRSGLIVANFVIRSVAQNADSIHSAKMDIERAVDEVKGKLPPECQMKMHLCSIAGCKELVIRDTEGYCSRHRAQKYHKRNAQKRNLLQLEMQRRHLESQMNAQRIMAPPRPPPPALNAVGSTVHALNAVAGNLNAVGGGNLLSAVSAPTLDGLSNVITMSSLSGQQQILRQNVAPQLVAAVGAHAQCTNGPVPGYNDLPQHIFTVNTVNAVNAANAVHAVNAVTASTPTLNGDSNGTLRLNALMANGVGLGALNVARKHALGTSPPAKRRKFGTDDLAEIDMSTPAVNACAAASAGIATPSRAQRAQCAPTDHGSPRRPNVFASILDDVQLSNVPSIPTPTAALSSSAGAKRLNDGGVNVDSLTAVTTLSGLGDGGKQFEGMNHFQGNALREMNRTATLDQMESAPMNQLRIVQPHSMGNGILALHHGLGTLPPIQPDHALGSVIAANDQQPPSSSNAPQSSGPQTAGHPGPHPNGGNGQNPPNVQNVQNVQNEGNRGPQCSLQLMSPNSSSTSSTVSRGDGSHLPLGSQLSLDPLVQNQLQQFLAQNLYVLDTPSSLSGVPIQQSSLRRDGMNIISVDYATQIPHPRQVLQKDGQLIVLGPKESAQTMQSAVSPGTLSSAAHSIRFPQFCHDLTQNYIACVPTPDCLVGSTLAATPQLSNNGIHMVAVNMQIQHPATMCNTPLKEKDLLLFQFNRAQDKGDQLSNAFEQIKMGHAAVTTARKEAD